MKQSSPWRRGLYAPWPLDSGFSCHSPAESRQSSPIPARAWLWSVLQLYLSVSSRATKPCMVLARNLRRR